MSRPVINRFSITAVQLGKEHDPQFDCDISAVSSVWLGNLVEKIEAFKYNNSPMAELTEKQATVMSAKLNGPSNLKKLEIFHDNKLSLIRPDKLASGLSSLSKLTLGQIPDNKKISKLFPLQFSKN